MKSRINKLKLGLIHALGGGGGGGTTTQTIQQADPWPGIQPYLSDVYGESQRLYRASGPSMYPGQTYAPLQPEQSAAQEAALSYAGMLPGLVSPAIGAQQFAMGPALYPESNPALHAHAEAAVQPLINQLLEQTLPEITSQAVQQGAYTGVRPEISRALATGRAADAAGRVTSDIYSQAYGQGLEHQARMAALTPSILGMGMMPVDIMSQVGAERRAEAQLPITEKMNRWQYGQQLPYSKLSDYAALIGSGPIGAGMTTTSAPGASSLQSFLGGGLTGLGLMSGLAQMTGGAVPGFGAFASAFPSNPLLAGGLSWALPFGLLGLL